MFLPIIVALGILFSTGTAINCDAKGLTPSECKQDIKNWEKVYEYPTAK